jgi:hypothetical protein
MLQLLWLCFETLARLFRAQPSLVVRQSDAELLFEINSMGCPSHSDDEIDLFLFGKSDLIQVVYTVKGREMSEEQRKVGIAAVSNWGLNPQKE